MSIEFKVSVIIPVFNAERFVEKAILSAINEDEVSEVIVIDDGSTDKSFEKIKKLEENYSKIKVFHHANRNNLGRSETRNLGIRKSKCKYIAFLDADDYYLPGRFSNDAKEFEKDLLAEGVYNAIGASFYRNPSESERLQYTLTTISEKIDPSDFFKKMVIDGDVGWFSGIGLTVKKLVFDKIGYFNPKLEVAEDSHLWVKLALKCRLIPGILDKPVSVRGIHENNTLQLKEKPFYIENYYRMYYSLLNWSYKNKEENYVLEFFWKELYKNFLRKNYIKKSWVLFLKKKIFVFKLLIRYPRLIKIDSFSKRILLGRTINSLKRNKI